MIGFDGQILTFLNHFAGRSIAVDTFVVLLTEVELVKGGVIMAMLWGGGGFLPRAMRIAGDKAF